MFRERCAILENKKVAPGHFVIRIHSPKISKNAKPGQFAQILCEDSYEPLLPRPFSFLTATDQDFSILYHVVGKGTKILSQHAGGESLWVLGPLGNGFERGGKRLPAGQAGKAESGKKMVLLGGGVGIPPLYHLAETLLKKKIKADSIHVFLGARHESLLLCEKDFKRLGVAVSVATDDGSKGHKGFVTELLNAYLCSTAIRYPCLSGRQALSAILFTCGPTPMLKAVSMIAGKYKLPCEVSVEVPMACGFGACLGCAIEVRGQKTEDREQKANRFAIACTEGPVFQAEEIIWEKPPCTPGVH